MVWRQHLLYILCRQTEWGVPTRYAASSFEVKLKGSLSKAAYDSFASAYEGRTVVGMQPFNTHYMRRREFRTIRAHGYVGKAFDRVRRRDIAGVITHYVKLRSASGALSDRTYTLAVFFSGNDLLEQMLVPTDIYVSGAEDDDDDDDEPPDTKDCNVDQGIGRGSKFTCETNTFQVLGNEDCPDANSGCPGTQCNNDGAEGTGGGGLSVPVVLGG